MNRSRTRIAPTPSGFLHLGNVFSFAVTAALAEHTGAKTLLRIDDLDQHRVTPEYVQDIFDTLHFMGIPWQEGPADAEEYKTTYSQLHRMPLYEKALEQLQNNGQVFACACSRSQLAAAKPCVCKDIPLEQPGVSWRLRTDHSTPLTVRTISGATVETTLPLSMKDFVVKKKDGFPAYQLSSVADDGHYAVDLVVRGQDLWDSTLAQLYLARLLPGSPFPQTIFFHHPLLTDDPGRKLSKSAGDASIRFLRNEGRQPGDIYASIAGKMGLHITAGNYQELAAPVIEHALSGNGQT
ncbi:glutamate--tRNA ligase family protein [Chitinophaga barathri]|nr:glutamate--tRNA ligase family protein [Chitinophaga barathri]